MEVNCMNKNKGGRPPSLTDVEREEIRRLKKQPRMTNEMIAERYGVSERTIERISVDRGNLKQEYDACVCNFVDGCNLYADAVKKGADDTNLKKLKECMDALALELAYKAMELSGYVYVREDGEPVGHYRKKK